MNLLFETQAILEKNDYAVRTSTEPIRGLIFEDDSIVGMVVAYESITSLLDNWEKLQDKFLQIHYSNMQKELAKAWNAYLIILTTQVPDSDTLNKLSAIEEDLRGARKIVATGIVSTTDIVKALMPILPIQKKVNITKENQLERLRKRIEVQELFSSKKVEDIFRIMESKK